MRRGAITIEAGSHTDAKHLQKGCVPNAASLATVCSAQFRTTFQSPPAPPIGRVPRTLEKSALGLARPGERRFCRPRSMLPFVERGLCYSEKPLAKFAERRNWPVVNELISSRKRINLNMAMWRMIMKWILASACLLAIVSVTPAEAKGCIKGAIVGGVAGHMAGHGKLGAAAGCAIGHHEANKPNPNNANAQAPSEQK